MPDTTYLPKVYMKQGGDEQVIASGGKQTVESGGIVDFETGSSFKLAGVEVTPSANELNQLDESAAVADGLSRVKLARATYDFAEHGGAISTIGLGVTIPDNAIILDGIVDVVTTLTTAGGDAGTIAIQVESANDIVSAIAVNDVSNPWDEGLQAIIPLGTAASAVKTTQAREISAVIAGQAVTAGKFIVFLRYVVSE